MKSTTVFGDNAAVICGQEDQITKIKIYDLTTGQMLQAGSFNLENAYRLAEVKLNGKLALAKKIEFRDANDLSRILHTHSVAPHRPSTLYAATLSTLLYVDSSKQPREVHWLDLSGNKPKSAAGKRVIHTHNAQTRDLCFTRDGNKQLLVVADGIDGLFAYNTETDKLEWKVLGTVPGMNQAADPMGVTTDGQGHLFVGDYVNGNKSIQMFSVLDGHYLGCLMKDVNAHGTPARLRWCDRKSSLVTTFFCKGEWHLKVITVQF